MKKYILLSIVLIVNNSLMSQTIINTWHNPYQTYNYTDPFLISFQPGFEYRPSYTGTYLHAYIDHNTVINNTYGTEVDPETRALDYTLPVGTLAGKSDVSLTGAMNYNIPIFTPPGVNNLVPSVSLNYNSQSKNGLAGFGWNLNCVSSISRSPQTNYYDDQSHPIDLSSLDRFSLDGQRLMLANSANYGDDGSEYLTDVFNGNKIILHKDSQGDVWFESVSQDNIIIEYGNTEDSRIEDLYGGEKKIISWNISKMKDQYGNYISYTYVKETVNDITSFRISEIQYTGNESINKAPDNKIQFLYSLRQDSKIGYQLGNGFNSNLLLKEIRVIANSQQVRKYVLDYFFEEVSKLGKVTEYGADNKPYNYTGFNYGEGVAPSRTVYYDLLDGSILEEDDFIAGLKYKYLPGDYNGDCKSDILRVSYTDHTGYEIIQRFELFINTTYFLDYEAKPSYVRKLDTKDNPDINILKTEHVVFGDLNGDGRADILLVDNYGTYGSPNYKFNTYFSKPNIYNTTSLPVFEGSIGKIGSINLVEYNNDGISDFLIFAKASSTSEYKANIMVSLQPTELYSAAYNDIIQLNELVNASDDILFGDFNGNGSTDILVQEQSSKIIKIYEYSKTTGSFIQLFNNIKTETDATFVIDDFNGDGNSDLIFYTQEWFETDPPPTFIHHPAKTYLYFSTGKSLVEATSPFDYSSPESHLYLPNDYNNDGIADILVFGPFSNQNNVEARIYSLRGGSFICENLQSPFTGWPDTKSSYYFADANSDGQSDLLAYNSSEKILNLLYFSPHSEEHLLTYITDGNNRVSQIQYNPLTQAPYYNSSNTDEYASISMNSVIGINMPIIGVIAKTDYESFSRSRYHLTEYTYD